MNKKKIIAVIIAREGSSRLPGKAIGEVHRQPMIGHIIDRLRGCKLISEVIVATTINKEDDAIANFASQKSVICFRGHPEDVLDRLFHAVVNIEFDALIEVGGDCPFISSDLLYEGIEHYLNNSDSVDFVSNALLPPYTYPDGYDFILLTKSTLQSLHNNAILQSERFQPFQFLIKNAAQFRSISFKSANSFNHWRWTLDYPEDLEFVKLVYKELYDEDPHFGFEKIKQLLIKKPHIAEINKMHAHNTMFNSAWYTGSYIAEAHYDIQSLLKECLNFDKEKKYELMSENYLKIAKIIEDLKMRAVTRKENG
jgi:spore coat polysaccharide biosynthesis protein SpsF